MRKVSEDVSIPLVAGLTIVTLSGYREAWWERHLASASGLALPIEILGWAMLSAFAVSVIVAAARPQSRVELRHPGVDTRTALLAACFCGSTVVGFAANFGAILTPLGASRASFVDYAAVPFFAIAISRVWEGALPRNDRALWTGLGACLLGYVFVLLSVSSGGSSSDWWPETITRGSALTLGVALALTSSAIGAMNLQIGRFLRATLSNEIILCLRLAAVGPILLLIARMINGGQWVLTLDWAPFVVGLGVLVYMPLFVVYLAVGIHHLARIAPFLFLMPVATFLLSLWPVRVRELSSVDGVEWLGMALVVGGLGYVEMTQAVAERRKRAIGADAPDPKPQAPRPRPSPRLT